MNPNVFESLPTEGLFKLFWKEDLWSFFFKPKTMRDVEKEGIIYRGVLEELLCIKDPLKDNIP